jgi:hypothetical protein
MSDFIYNKIENLRCKLSDVHYTYVNFPEGGNGYFAVVTCADRGVHDDWTNTKTYCGLVLQQGNAEEIKRILATGEKWTAP